MRASQVNQIAAALQDVRDLKDAAVFRGHRPIEGLEGQETTSNPPRLLRKWLRFVAKALSCLQFSGSLEKGVHFVDWHGHVELRRFMRLITPTILGPFCWPGSRPTIFAIKGLKWRRSLLC